MEKRKKPSHDDRSASNSKKAKTNSSGTNKEAFLRSLKSLKFLINMDWRGEAAAIIEDIKNFVSKIEISSGNSQSDMRIYFNVETLERSMLIVSMDSCGFKICKGAIEQSDDTDDGKVYETINALLDDNSPLYRETFAQALMEKIQCIE